MDGELGGFIMLIIIVVFFTLMGVLIGTIIGECDVENKIIQYGKEEKVINYNSETGKLQYTDKEDVNYKKLIDKLEIKLENRK